MVWKLTSDRLPTQLMRLALAFSPPRRVALAMFLQAMYLKLFAVIKNSLREVTIEILCWGSASPMQTCQTW